MNLRYLVRKYLTVRPKYDIIPSLTIDKSPSPNFTPCPEGREIKCVVLHGTASDTMESALRWFKNKLSGVAAHYVVDKDGKIAQCVALKDIAWHAGKSQWRGLDGCNKFSVGIELVNREDGKDVYPVQQINSCLTLCFVLCEMYGLDSDSITTHKDIASGRKFDPVGLDISGFKESLKFYQEEKEVFKT